MGGSVINGVKVDGIGALNGLEVVEVVALVVDIKSICLSLSLILNLYVPKVQ